MCAALLERSIICYREVMSIHRLNHAVLYVRDTARSVAFYRDVLGFEVVNELGGYLTNKKSQFHSKLKVLLPHRRYIDI